jgi:hypothetical protein
MRAPWRGGWVDPATWYAIAGVGLIATSLWLPWATAARTARVEMRADRLSELLMRAGRTVPVDATPADLEHVWGCFLALAQADGAFFADVERLEPPPDDTLLAFTNKHYAFQLARSPVDPQAAANGSDGGELPLETIAWPLHAAGPGHAVYFHADDAPRAYTRNLTSGYVGLRGSRPRPGDAHRGNSLFDTPTSYRSAGDERWILY